MNERDSTNDNRPPAGTQADSGRTSPVQGETQHGVPRAPHERDESADSQAGDEPSGRRLGQAAHDDVQRGLVDTDKGPAMDRAYDKVRQGTGDNGKKFRP